MRIDNFGVVSHLAVHIVLEIYDVENISVLKFCGDVDLLLIDTSQ